MLIHGMPLLDVKVGVSCAVGATYGPTFYWALNAHHYIKHSEVIETSSLTTRAPAFLFQQDSATSHTTITSVLCV
jgi:hypothetical protein